MDFSTAKESADLNIRIELDFSSISPPDLTSVGTELQHVIEAVRVSELKLRDVLWLNSPAIPLLDEALSNKLEQWTYGLEAAKLIPANTQSDHLMLRIQVAGVSVALIAELERRRPTHPKINKHFDATFEFLRLQRQQRAQTIAYYVSKRSNLVTHYTQDANNDIALFYGSS